MQTVKDASLSVSKALPAGASTIYTDPIQVKGTTAKEFHAACELQVEAPALAVGELANASTMKYDVQHCDTSGGSYTAIAKEVVSQVGAGGAGAAAQVKRFRLPSDVKPFVRVAVTNSAAADASAKSVTASLMF